MVAYICSGQRPTMSNCGLQQAPQLINQLLSDDEDEDEEVTDDDESESGMG